MWKHLMTPKHVSLLNDISTVIWISLISAPWSGQVFMDRTTEWKSPAERNIKGDTEQAHTHLTWCHQRPFRNIQRRCVRVKIACRFPGVSANLHVLSSPTRLLYFLPRLVESLSLTWRCTASMETHWCSFSCFSADPGIFSILKASRVSVEITASINTCAGWWILELIVS